MVSERLDVAGLLRELDSDETAEGIRPRPAKPTRASGSNPSRRPATFGGGAAPTPSGGRGPRSDD